jgi:predicted short-subunit dehydrogenase-like oxidoreductase (DUF2520 family)
MLPRISIIGPGKVGTALGVLAAEAGYTIAAVGGRDPERIAAAARRIGHGVRAVGIREAAGAGDVVLLTVSDDAIETVCRELVREKALRHGAVVAHCSGALSSDVLSSAREDLSCSVASMHPLQTLPTVEAAVEALPGTCCFYEGDEAALPLVEDLIRRVGMRPVKIEVSAKVLYHAAAVMASNYLVAIMDAALAVAEKAGIERSIAWPAFEPLVLSTIANISKIGPAEALTGPIARGDVETVKRHLQSLDLMDRSLASLYRALGRYSVELAVRKGSISSETAEKLLSVLIQER